ncbi:tRNA (N(6)-L-threonylcarbamoyladenosine(37)-C(2))-methylthiotransferase MtaB, partial [bacterium]|nr:tRNA (N(6)-L-threonylcarbamoyladenosine(37)-C(2))-methylthiotransferase MtaB [bacterium]
MDKLSDRTIEQHSSILFDSLGCKLNKYEIELMRSQAEELGLISLSDTKVANVVVINTCSVTNQASRDSRRKIRSLRKHNPDSYLVVTGCYSQTEIEEVKELGVDMILSNFEKESFFEKIRPQIRDYEGKTQPSNGILNTVQFQSRPFLKIQDGCDAFCSYCIIPRARGRSRSFSPETVLQQVRELAPRYPEIVLSGVNLGQYGVGTQTGLFELLKEIVKIKELRRVRISSLEPQDLSDELLDLIVSSEKICDHLHLPLQGAHDELLPAMRRNYSLKYYADRLERIKSLNSSFCLGADVMVGFPGETETIFQESRKNLKNFPLDYFHVFSFSPREKTVAMKMSAQIEMPLKKERNRVMTELSNQRKEKFVA